ncbi:MAG: C_GCAxxG_C_C family protein [Deltaproteobacteria bacterium]|nr:MAG: C_GCAxxG_C_C family protein [Deltaproteobacteria bacterium]
MGRREDTMLKAVTGLEGGVVASGSTCGVVTGGALALALMNDATLKEGDLPAERDLLTVSGDYLNWFTQHFGTTRCRDRTGIDFYKRTGQLRYLLPGDRVARCLFHIGRAVGALIPYIQKGLPPIDYSSQAEAQTEPMHCARLVLESVREKTGIGDRLLERSSIVFDGGVGLKGGICGALVGALMAVNILYGTNIRQMSYFRIVKAFLVGHQNLLADSTRGTPEAFGVGKNILQEFRHRAGATECREITDKAFGDWQDFQGYISTAEKCKDLISFAAEMASEAIEKWK